MSFTNNSSELFSILSKMYVIFSMIEMCLQKKTRAKSMVKSIIRALADSKTNY